VKTLIAFGILLFIALIGSIKLFNKIKASSCFAYILYSGTIYVFFGLIVGENGFNLISKDIIHQLAPLINFSLGWVGFIFGLQFEIKYLKRIPKNWYLTLPFTYLTSFFTIVLFSFIIFNYIFDGLVQTIEIALGISFVLAILLSESSVSFISWSSKFLKKEFLGIRICFFISAINNLIPIILTGVIFSLYKYVPASNIISLNAPKNILPHFFIQLMIGILSGFFMFYLVKKITNKLEISAVLFGTIFFISGLSSMFHFSPLFVSMLCGVIFSNLTHRHSYFIKIFNPTEKPIYIIFLIFLSLKKAIFNKYIIFIAIFLLLVKFLSKLFTFKSLNKTKLSPFNISPYFSYILLPISSIAPAILLDLLCSYPQHSSSIAQGIFIIALIISEIFSPLGIKLLKIRSKND